LDVRFRLKHDVPVFALPSSGRGIYPGAATPRRHRLARWLADHGIAAFVLKYRVRPFLEALSERRKTGGVPDPAMVQGYPPAIEDGKAALRLVHSRAANWGSIPTASA
jgi:hypothetical protein